MRRVVEIARYSEWQTRSHIRQLLAYWRPSRTPEQIEAGLKGTDAEERYDSLKDLLERLERSQRDNYELGRRLAFDPGIRAIDRRSIALKLHDPETIARADLSLRLELAATMARLETERESPIRP